MKKKILFTLYDLEIGGIERSFINMLNSFDYQKYEIDILLFNHKGELLEAIPEKANLITQKKELTVFRKPLKQCLKEGHIIASLCRMIAKVVANRQAKKRRLIEGGGYIQMQLALKYSLFFLSKLEKKYDIAISYAWPHDYVATKVSAEKKIAWIHTDYSNLEINNKQDYRIWSRFNHIISISEKCTTSFLSTYPSLKGRITEIENINSPALIKKMAHQFESKELNRESFNIVSVGRLSYAKGYDMAIEAMKQLKLRGFSNIKWYVVGYGTEEKNLKEQINEAQLHNEFILLGKKTNPYPYIHACDVYIQPSRYEGKAVTVTEAKILSKPIVITDYPTAKSQLVSGEEGIICPLSIEGIADEIEKLYKDDVRREQYSLNLSKKDFSNLQELEKLYFLFGEKIDGSVNGLMRGKEQIDESERRYSSLQQ
ncbi:glycosyltransferase [Bacillus carboniphilus]|uniref:Glycosyltransferase n=1 Tax=Bacillus carboniphilus TaxID=86663 RepID=A0ABY9JTS1_9BACI|nr:glycosyltransferase [Bacillus carboniphilus]WLR42789.1 glycosyltransferase [Bacillus carboniphilus]